MKKRMMIVMDDVLDFVRKSICSECIIGAGTMEDGYNDIKIIQIDKNNSENSAYVIIRLLKDNTIVVDTNNHGHFIINDISNKEIAEFNLLIEECIEHNKEVGMNIFENFFDIKNNKPTDINDLDNEDD